MSIKVESTTENLSVQHSTNSVDPVVKMGYCSCSTACDVRRKS